MKISGKTNVCCIIGNPIEHSLSPAMHNAAYEKLGLNFAYIAFRVEDVRCTLSSVENAAILINATATGMTKTLAKATSDVVSVMENALVDHRKRRKL